MRRGGRGGVVVGGRGVDYACGLGVSLQVLDVGAWALM